MNALVVGGTRFFGVHTVNALIDMGYDVTIATRGITKDNFGDAVERIVLDRTDPESIKAALSGRHFDICIDKIAYCSNDIKNLLDVLDCDRYIYMSSCSVYEKEKMNTLEEEFDPMTHELKWYNREDAGYDAIKRSAEAALWQKYGDRDFVSVRYPYVVGEDDYTRRLMFYVEHTMKGIPMHVDNLDEQIGFINSEEAGEFMAHLVEADISGAVNGCSTGTVSLREIIEYVEEKTGTKAVFNVKGDQAPYNGSTEYSINTDKAEESGYIFSDLFDWLWELLDYYIALYQGM